MYELHVKSHEASEWAGTCDCINNVFFSGSIPDAIYIAKTSKVLLLKSAGNCFTVMACKSTTQN